MKSERLKKLETELRDLEQWLRLGLVPRKDIDKHKEEIRSIQGKISEERERLQFLKESGDLEEFSAPRRTPPRSSAYPETTTIPDIDMAEESSGLTDVGLEMETDTLEADAFPAEERDEDEAVEEEEEEEEEDPFSDRNRWKRGIMDPDSDDW
jgi:hypothetical protein